MFVYPPIDVFPEQRIRVSVLSRCVGVPYTSVGGILLVPKCTACQWIFRKKNLPFDESVELRYAYEFPADWRHNSSKSR